ncbi:MAG TPA: LuxR C-terminal-related transcriptional regulator [Solirubrobacter sp.]|nr:LuxR C-terminal-related transcriptional regulator [Solirubrobacter sp.]
MKLTPREQEIVALSASHTASEIGEMLGITQQSVYGHRMRINRKLGTSSAAEAYAEAKTRGLLTGEANAREVGKSSVEDTVTEALRNAEKRLDDELEEARARAESAQAHYESLKLNIGTRKAALGRSLAALLGDPASV